MIRQTRAELAMEVWRAMIGVSQQIGRRSEKQMSDLDINPAQYLMLATIDRRGPLSQSELGRELGSTAANVSQLTTKLEHAGLVQREQAGRTNLVVLTNQGSSMLQMCRPRHRDFVESQFEALTKEEMVEMKRLLAKLLA